jgi:hypothetical protein
MKKLLIAATMLAVVASASAQGRITFGSAAVGVNARFVLDSAGPLGGAFISGTNTTIRADLFWSVGTTTVGVTPDQLVNAGGLNQAFNTGAQAGYFTGGVKTITPANAGESIVAQVRVWDTAFGSYAAARNAPGAYWGESVLFTITPAGAPPAVAPNLVGLGSGVTYTLTYNPIIPEPSSMALAGLGAASLLLFRRRK